MEILYASNFCVQCQRHVWQERAPSCQLSSHQMETDQDKTKNKEGKQEKQGKGEIVTLLAP